MTHFKILCAEAVTKQTERGCGKVFKDWGIKKLHEIIAVAEVRCESFYQSLHEVGDIV